MKNLTAKIKNLKNEFNCGLNKGKERISTLENMLEENRLCMS